MLFHENDISAQEAFTRQGSRIQSENEYEGWKKSFSGQTCKGKKSIVRLGHRNVTFLCRTSNQFAVMWYNERPPAWAEGYIPAVLSICAGQPFVFRRTAAPPGGGERQED